MIEILIMKLTIGDSFGHGGGCYCLWLIEPPARPAHPLSQTLLRKDFDVALMILVGNAHKASNLSTCWLKTLPSIFISRHFLSYFFNSRLMDSLDFRQQLQRRSTNPTLTEITLCYRCPFPSLLKALTRSHNIRSYSTS